MLRALEIRNLLIIERLELHLQPGLNVLTGETGAGKSILLDALGFVLGWRGRAALVRQGTEQGEVTAVFELTGDHPARSVLESAGLPDGDELILRRVNTSDGRKTSWVNDRRCSGDIVRELSDTLVELHGQQDDRGLLNPRTHRTMLDDFAGLEGQRKRVRSAWSKLAAAQRQVDETTAALEKIRAEEDYLRHAVGEFDTLDPQPGEDGDLDAQRRMMQGAERIRDDIHRAAGLLGSDGAESAMSDALRWLDGVADKADGQLDDALGALGRALVELGEAQSGVDHCLQALDFDPGELEQVEERLFAIRAMARKHDVLPDELNSFAESLRSRLTALDSGSENLQNEEQKLRAAQADYDRAAAQLSADRKKAAQRLDKAVMAELAPLKMERAIFQTRISPSDPGPDGCDTVAFTVATNPGAPAGALNKIASGGELSRFLLALKVCLVGQDTGRTMIFDEIDRGVGGATADAVGRRLAQLSHEAQILVVTHSPQVAAQGRHHWRVEKHVTDGQTLSTVMALDAQDRVDEVARMVSGDRITDEARAAARVLLRS